MQFVNHLLKELAGESTQDVAFTGHCKITQKFNFIIFFSFYL